ncbi:17484_t:CDS:2 [Cetraspora pellucida]|uniref:17484_t:CDS:1 n=1 Tax=Cetraspora pellucida TaxID=1433469 RepID=A0A9N9NTQ2_9GLOM|nr:17484_t:CDS:2 [Cetraspora pellucida]
MPCYIDTVVKVNQVYLFDKNESKLTIVWAIGVYPPESEDHELEMVLFVPINSDERDPNSQSIFVKGEYYSVDGKVVPRNYNSNLRLKRDPSSNRCPLRVSLVGITQDAMREVNEENVIVSVSWSSDSLQIVLEDPKSVRSRHLSTHQSACGNLSKVPVVENFDNNVHKADSADDDCYSSKCVKVEDEDDCYEYVDSYNSKHDHMVECNSRYLEENHKYGIDITLEITFEHFPNHSSSFTRWDQLAY